jgi:hypothetical protein
VPSKYYTNRNNHIFTHCLDKGQSEWNTPSIQAVSCTKFRLNTASSEMFILNFSRCRVLLARAYITQELANKKPLWPGWRQTHAYIGAIWPVESISGICRVTRYKRRIVFTYKTVTKTKCSKGPKLFSAKGMASLYFCSKNCVIWKLRSHLTFKGPYIATMLIMIITNVWN